MAAAIVFHVSVAVAWFKMVDPFTGAVLLVQPGTGMAAVVNVVSLVIPQLFAGPLAFLCVIYQLYTPAGIKL